MWMEKRSKGSRGFITLVWDVQKKDISGVSVSAPALELAWTGLPGGDKRMAGTDEESLGQRWGKWCGSTEGFP